MNVKFHVELSDVKVGLDIVEQKLMLNIGQVEIPLEVNPDITSAILKAVSGKMNVPKGLEAAMDRLAAGVQKKSQQKMPQEKPKLTRTPTAPQERSKHPLDVATRHRRTADEIQNVADRMFAYVKTHPGVTMLQMQEALSLQPGEGHRPMALLLGNDSVKRRGVRSHTKYFAKK